MAKAQVRVLPSARNTVMVVDDQSTGRAILEQVVRSLDERVVVEGFARPVDAVVWATRNVSDLVQSDILATKGAALIDVLLIVGIVFFAGIAGGYASLRMTPMTFPWIWMSRV
jgi:molybdopterin-guanine dinucleotide biosynthesis protein